PCSARCSTFIRRGGTSTGCSVRNAVSSPITLDELPGCGEPDAYSAGRSGPVWAGPDRLSTAVRDRGSSHLLEHADEVVFDDLFDDLSVAAREDADAGDGDRLAGGGDAGVFALVGSGRLPAGDDAIAGDQLLADGAVKVGHEAEVEVVLLDHCRDSAIGTAGPVGVDVPQVGVEDLLGDGLVALAPEGVPELPDRDLVV